MPVSQRIQNIQRNPSTSRNDFHQVAAQMMGQKKVTKSWIFRLKKIKYHKGLQSFDFKRNCFEFNKQTK